MARGATTKARSGDAYDSIERRAGRTALVATDGGGRDAGSWPRFTAKQPFHLHSSQGWIGLLRLVGCCQRTSMY